jgi:5-methylcytosine-specific restriction endonuclease McrA
MANQRSCGSINAEIARVKKRKRQDKRAQFANAYEQSKGAGLPHRQAIAIASQAKRDLAQGKQPKPLIRPESDDFLLSYEWRRARMTALKRYGAKCQCCGATPETGARINVDHIKPRKIFPHLALDQDNLQVLCHECNHGKGNWDMTDWRSRETT